VQQGAENQEFAFERCMISQEAVHLYFKKVNNLKPI
jgi:hypothetical protein